jgi:phosphatidylinositol phospholipase C beta
MLKRKILIKNKRLRPEVEKQELELFKQGQFVIEDEVKEDFSAPPIVAAVVEQQPVKVTFVIPQVTDRSRPISPPFPLTGLNDCNIFKKKEGKERRDGDVS